LRKRFPGWTIISLPSDIWQHESDAMGRVFVNTLFWFFLALLFAATYASVESAPYSEGLPVWRPDPNLWWVRLLFWFPNLGRPVNGLDTFGLLFFGTTCLLLVPVWNALHGHPLPKSELLELVAYVFAVAVIEDWVWYAINPHAGFKRFNAAVLPRWMYADWFWGFPSQYWQGLLASYVAILCSVKARSPSLSPKSLLRESGSAFAILWTTLIALVLLTALTANYTWMDHRNF
jgi:hypothetical protein